MSTPRVQAFDPKQSPVNFLGKVLTGFSQNIIRWTPDTDLSVDESGADQETTVILQGDFRATFEIFLQQSSRSNQILSNAANAFRFGGLIPGVSSGPFLWEDTLGTDIISGPVSWVLGYAPVTRGKTVNEMVWRLRTNNFIANLGGSDQVVA